MQSTPDIGARNAAREVALSAAQAELLNMYVAVGVLVAVILVLLLVVIILVVCFCTNRSVVYSLKATENNYSPPENNYSPPPPSKLDQV